jgi:hypothetical protein
MYDLFTSERERKGVAAALTTEVYYRATGCTGAVRWLGSASPRKARSNTTISTDWASLLRVLQRATEGAEGFGFFESFPICALKLQPYEAYN